MAHIVTTFTSVMKEALEDAVRDQQPYHVTLRNFFRKSADGISQGYGRDLYVYIPMQLGRSQGQGAAAYGSALPATGAPVFAQTRVNLARNYHQINFDPIIRLMKAGVGAWNKTISGTTEDAMKTFFLDEARQYALDGSGALCRVLTTGATGTSFVVDDATYLERGMIVDGFAAKTGGSATIHDAVISYVDHITNTVTIASCTWGTNDYLFRANNRGIEMNGLQSGIDDGVLVPTFQNVTRSSTPEFCANFIAAASAPLSLKLFLSAVTQTRAISGETPNLIMSRPDEQDKWIVSQQANVRINDTVKLKTGAMGITIVAGGKEIPWFTDPYLAPSVIYGVNTKDIGLFELNDVELIDYDGSSMSRVHGYDMGEMTLCHYGQMGFRRCNTHFRIAGYSDPTT